MATRVQVIVQVEIVDREQLVEYTNGFGLDGSDLDRVTALVLGPHSIDEATSGCVVAGSGSKYGGV